MSKLPIVAAIPTYNMANSLGELLPQVLAQDYDKVIVMDDDSTDSGATRDMLAGFGKDITTVYGRANLGSGGNRNRVFEALAGKDANIHFLDADVELLSERNPERIRGFPTKKIAFIGGLVLDDAGNQSLWNFGPHPGLFAMATAGIQMHRDRLPKIVAPLLRGRPDPSARPISQRIFWPLESNMVVRASVLDKIGRFDPTIREQDIMLPAIRARRQSMLSVFYPGIAVQQHKIEVRSYNRPLRKLHEEGRVIRELGLVDWLLPDGKIMPSF